MFFFQSVVRIISSISFKWYQVCKKQSSSVSLVTFFFFVFFSSLISLFCHITLSHFFFLAIGFWILYFRHYIFIKILINFFIDWLICKSNMSRNMTKQLLFQIAVMYKIYSETWPLFSIVIMYKNNILKHGYVLHYFSIFFLTSVIFPKVSAKYFNFQKQNPN